jgi:outer membrane protein assembly factor BamB
MKNAAAFLVVAVLAGCGGRMRPAYETDQDLNDYTDYGSAPVRDELRTLPFKDIVWEFKFSKEIKRLTLGSTNIYLETPDNDVMSVDRFTGVAQWTYHIDTDTPLDWAPVEAAGVPERIRELEGKLAAKNREIDNMLKTKGPGKETQELQKQRDQMREQLKVEQYGDNVYFISRGTMYCLVRSTGNLLWTKHLHRTFTPGGRPYAIRSHVFVPGANLSRVWALDVAQKGRDVAFFKTNIGAHDKAITAQPVYNDPSLYFCSHDGYVYSYSLQGDRNWLFPDPTGGGPLDEMRADPLVHRFSYRYMETQVKGDEKKEVPKAFDVTYLFAGGYDHAFYAIDATSGALLWKYETAGQIKTPAAAKDGTVYVKTEAGALFAFDIFPMHRNAKGGIDIPKTGGEWPWKRSGSLRWKLPLGERFLVKGKDRVYVMGPNSQIYAMDEFTGDIHGRYPVNLLTHIVTNSTDNILYVANAAGYVFAVRESKD